MTDTTALKATTSFNWPHELEHCAQHYAALSKLPAWNQYARQQVRDMEAEDGGHWIGLLARVREILAEKKS